MIAWRMNAATTCVGVNPIDFMIPISRRVEITTPVTRLATIAAAAIRAKALNASSRFVRMELVMLKTLRISR